MRPAITYLIDDGVLVIDGDRRFSIEFLRQMDYEIVNKCNAKIATLERERDAAVAVVEKIAALADQPTPCVGVRCAAPDADGNQNVCLVHIAPIMAKAAIAKARVPA